MHTYCGLIAVLGQANAGKSTLINALVGEKVSIVSSKPHTTRYGIFGILNQEASQIILMDTPGLIPHPQGPLQQFMARVTARGAQDADLFLVVIDASRPQHEATRSLLSGLKDKPLVIAFNKVDLVHKPVLLTLAETYQAYTPHIMMISSKKKKGLEDLLSHLKQNLPEGPWLFPQDDLTQLSGREWAAEITREKVFTCVHEEIPYHAHVHTDSWEETPKALTLKQTILVAKPKHRQLVLGHKGKRIHIIGQQARQELMDYFQKPVHLFLHVKVDPKWTNALA